MTSQVNINAHLNEDRDVITFHINEFKKTSSVPNGIIASLNAKFTGEAIKLIKEIEDLVGSTPTTNFINSDLVEFHNTEIYVSLEFNGSSINIFEDNIVTFDLNIYGEAKKVHKIYDFLKKKYKSTGPQVAWYFRDSDGDLQYSNFELSNDRPAYKEFYPFVKDFDVMGKNFLESTKNVLILLGPPGTGKTSLIRHLLLKLNEGAITTYDSDIMNMDKFYIRFLNSSFNFVVLEDADLLLLGRDQDDNRVMSKILNTSDGLVNTSHKKFIFTANITQQSRIDEALIRPGRCFDVINFRALTSEESVKAAKQIGVDIPKDGEDRTLAEIFNNTPKKKKTARMGF